MSLFSDPPRSTKYSFRRGDIHLGVWALQRFLGKLNYGPFADLQFQTGFFGTVTEQEIRHYQAATGATVDGIVGPQTQARIVRSCVVRAPGGSKLPKGLIEGQINAESGRLLAAVNSAVAGGLDLGLTQRRVYGPPYKESDVKFAMDPLVNVSRSVDELLTRYESFKSRVGAGEYAWRLAALAHNWPSGADQLSRGRPLSTTRRATWAPAGTKFADGAQVYSYADWANYYAMGSRAHHHPGVVTSLAFGVPVR